MEPADRPDIDDIAPGGDVDPIDALGPLPAAVGADGRALDGGEGRRVRGEGGGRLTIAQYAVCAVCAAAFLIVAAFLGIDTTPERVPEEGVDDTVEVIGAPTDAARVEVDPDATHPQPAVLEELRWADGATIEAVLFVDDCTTPHSIDATSDGDTVTVAVTVGGPAGTDDATSCGEPALAAVTVTVDPSWVGLPLTEAAPLEDSIGGGQ